MEDLMQILLPLSWVCFIFYILKRVPLVSKKAQYEKMIREFVELNKFGQLELGILKYLAIPQSRTDLETVIGEDYTKLDIKNSLIMLKNLGVIGEGDGLIHIKPQKIKESITRMKNLQS